MALDLSALKDVAARVEAAATDFVKAVEDVAADKADIDKVVASLEAVVSVLTANKPAATADPATPEV